MERLTKQSESGMTWFIDHENNGIALEPCEMDSHNNRLAIERLADYENAEEQGLLLKLPCKDVFYIVDKGTKYEMVMSKSIDNLNLYEIRGIDKDGYYWSARKLAEESLKESGG